MKNLLTGFTGYLASRLLPVILVNGYEVVCWAIIQNYLSSQTIGNRY